MKKALVLVVCLLYLALGARPVWAIDTTWYPGSIPLGLDARSLGMGGACLAVIGPWVSPANPAALVFLTNQGVFAGRYVDPVFDPVSSLGEQEDIYLFYVHPNGGNGAYSVGVFQNSFSCLFDYKAVFTHTYTEFTAFQYGYANSLSEQVSLGLNLRYIQSVDRTTLYDLFNGFFTADIGAVFRPNKAITASILVTDVLARKVHFDVDADDDGEPDEYFYYSVPTRVLFGGSLRIGGFFLIAMDVDYNIMDYDDLWYMTRAGVELRPLPFLAIRGGYYHGQPTMGIGISLGKPDGVQVNLDFGQYWPDPGNYLNITQSMQMVVFF